MKGLGVWRTVRNRVAGAQGEWCRKESSASGEGERPLFYTGPGGLAKRNEEPSKDLLSAKGHDQLYLLGPYHRWNYRIGDTAGGQVKVPCQ